MYMKQQAPTLDVDAGTWNCGELSGRIWWVSELDPPSDWDRFATLQDSSGRVRHAARIRDTEKWISVTNEEMALAGATRGMTEVLTALDEARDLVEAAQEFLERFPRGIRIGGRDE